MLNREDCINQLRDNKQLFSQKFKVHSMRLFGSVARNEHTETSDVDVMVEMEPNLLLQVGLKQYLESKLGCHVDVIRRHKGMDAFFLKQIQHDGVVIFN